MHGAVKNIRNDIYVYISFRTPSLGLDIRYRSRCGFILRLSEDLLFHDLAIAAIYLWPVLRYLHSLPLKWLESKEEISRFHAHSKSCRYCARTLHSV